MNGSFQSRTLEISPPQASNLILTHLKTSYFEELQAKLLDLYIRQILCVPQSLRFSWQFLVDAVHGESLAPELNHSFSHPGTLHRPKSYIGIYKDT